MHSSLEEHFHLFLPHSQKDKSVLSSQWYPSHKLINGKDWLLLSQTHSPKSFGILLFYSNSHFWQFSSLLNNKQFKSHSIEEQSIFTIWKFFFGKFCPLKLILIRPISEAMYFSIINLCQRNAPISWIVALKFISTAV